MTWNENVKKAIDYATLMHANQKRKDGSPYIKHPINVLKNVLNYKESKSLETLLIAACLHDTLEDTEASYYDLVQKFGIQVASLVLEVTTDEEMKNEIGKEKYLSIKMKNMSSWALVIKLCDRLDNINDLNVADEKFKNKYINETINILEFLIEKRKLSKTHINIIEQILCTLLQLCKNDDKKYGKIEKMVICCKSLKNIVTVEFENFNKYEVNNSVIRKLVKPNIEH